MEEKSPFLLSLAVVFALLYFVLASAFAIAWYVFDELRSADGGSLIDGHSKFRNFWELIYFISNSVIVFVAALALVVARNQLRSADHTRSAANYMEISKRWEAPKLIAARRRIHQLGRFWERHRSGALAQYRNRGDYIKAILLELRETDPARLQQEYMVLGAFFEDLGVLGRRGYVQLPDLFDYLADPIIRYSEDLLPYILEVRGDDDAIYANVLWLLRSAREHRPFRDRGDGLHPETA